MRHDDLSIEELKALIDKRRDTVVLSKVVSPVELLKRWFAIMVADWLKALRFLDE